MNYFTFGIKKYRTWFNVGLCSTVHWRYLINKGTHLIFFTFIYFSCNIHKILMGRYYKKIKTYFEWTQGYDTLKWTLMGGLYHVICWLFSITRGWSRHDFKRRRLSFETNIRVLLCINVTCYFFFTKEAVYSW